MKIRLKENKYNNILGTDQGARIQVYENNTLVTNATLRGNGTAYTPYFSYTPKSDGVSIRIRFLSMDCGTDAISEVYYYGYGFLLKQIKTTFQ